MFLYCTGLPFISAKRLYILSATRIKRRGHKQRGHNLDWSDSHGRIQKWYFHVFLSVFRSNNKYLLLVLYSEKGLFMLAPSWYVGN